MLPTDVVTKKKKAPPKSKNIIKTSEKVKDNTSGKVPCTGRIINETTDSKTSTIGLTLSNGAKIILNNISNKKVKANRLRICALANGGVLHVSKKDIIATRFLPDLLGEYAEQLGFYTEFISFDVGEITHGFSVISTYDNPDIVNSFDLIYRFFTTNPEFDSKAIKLDMAMRKAQMQYYEHVGRYNDNYYYYNYYYNNDPYYNVLKSSDFAKFDINTELKLIKKYLNIADYTFVFAGENIDVNVFRGYVKTYLASIPARKVNVILPKYKCNYYAKPGQVKHKIYEKSARKFSRADMYFFLNGQYSRQNEIIAMVLQEYLKSIIEHVFKKNMVLPYVYAFGWLESISFCQDLKLLISFNCDTNKLDEYVDAVKGLMEEIVKGNINIDIFNKTKIAVKKCGNKRHQTKRLAVFSVVFDKPFNFIYEQEKLYDAITPKDLQEMVAKILENRITCILRVYKNLGNKD
jgi:hypothetical protein